MQCQSGPKKHKARTACSWRQKKAEFVNAAGGKYREGISKAAKAWKELPRAEKEPFEDKAAKQKGQYKEDF